MSRLRSVNRKGNIPHVGLHDSRDSFRAKRRALRRSRSTDRGAEESTGVGHMSPAILYAVVSAAGSADSRPHTVGAGSIAAQAGRFVGGCRSHSPAARSVHDSPPSSSTR